jgi:hypothetical protein
MRIAWGCADLALQFAITGGIDVGERRARCRKRLRIGDTACGSEDAQELITLAANPAKQTKLLQDHSPRNDGEEKKQAQDDSSDPTRLFKNAAKVGGEGCEQEKRNVNPTV